MFPETARLSLSTSLTAAPRSWLSPLPSLTTALSAGLSLDPPWASLRDNRPQTLALGSVSHDNVPHGGHGGLTHFPVVGSSSRHPLGAGGPPVTSAEQEEHGQRPQRLDILIVLICAAADLFISGLLTGAPVETSFGTELPLWPVVAAITLSYSVLAWRRQAPWHTFLAVLAACLAAALLLVPFQPMVAVALALHTVARRSPARRANPALVLAAFVSLVNARTATNVGETNEDGVFGLIVIAAIFMGLFTLVWALGRRERTTRLRAAEAQERLMATAEASLGQQRQQIARDLHDILSHSMSAMILQSAGAKAVSSKLDSTTEAKQVTDALAAIESTGAESMRELHRLLGLLRTQDEGDETGITRLRLADIDPLIAATRHGGLVVQHHREGAARPLDASVDLAAYHMVQESLTNAMKHAGRGAVVDIYETWEPDRLQLQVRSSRGIDDSDVQPASTPASSGTGLWGLKERVELAGGSFESGRVEGGFVTSASLPVRATTSTTTERTGTHTSNPTERTGGHASDATERTGETISTHREPPRSTPAEGAR